MKAHEEGMSFEEIGQRLCVATDTARRLVRSAQRIFAFPDLTQLSAEEARQDIQRIHDTFGEPRVEVAEEGLDESMDPESDAAYASWMRRPPDSLRASSVIGAGCSAPSASPPESAPRSLPSRVTRLRA